MPCRTLSVSNSNPVVFVLCDIWVHFSFMLCKHSVAKHVWVKWPPFSLAALLLLRRSVSQSFNATSSSHSVPEVLAAFQQSTHMLPYFSAVQKKPVSFTCRYCLFTGKQRTTVIVHERTHTGEKPYKCRFCPYATAQQSNVKKHERKHTGEKPFKCKWCNYETSRTESLKVHERTHTGEKPYKCRWCDYATTQSCHLSLHEKRHGQQVVWSKLESSIIHSVDSRSSPVASLLYIFVMACILLPRHYSWHLGQFFHDCTHDSRNSGPSVYDPHVCLVVFELSWHIYTL